MPSPTHAQQAPDVGRILQQTAPQALPTPLPPATPPPPAVPLPPPGGATVMVRGFHIVASAFPEAELRAVVRSFVGRNLTLAELQEAARKIDAFYLAHDLLARAVLPPQNLKNGIVEIRVIEGRISAVTVDPSSHSRLKPDIAAGIVADQAPVGGPVRPSQLEAGMALLNEMPGVAATATLVPGINTGDTAALLKLQDTPLVSGSAAVDNGGIRRDMGLGTLAVVGLADARSAATDARKLVQGRQDNAPPTKNFMHWRPAEKNKTQSQAWDHKSESEIKLSDSVPPAGPSELFQDAHGPTRGALLGDDALSCDACSDGGAAAPYSGSS